MKLQHLEQMAAPELREIITKLFDIIQGKNGQEPVLSTGDALDMIVEILVHVEQDHEAAKIAIGLYNDLVTHLTRALATLAQENEKLRDSINNPN